MSSRIYGVHSQAKRNALVLLVLLGLSTYAGSWQLRAALPPSPGAVPSDEQISEAVRQLKNDPNLPGLSKERVLRWVDKKAPPPRPPTWIEWVANFFRWLARTSRFLFWGGVALLAGFLALYLWRLLGTRVTRQTAGRFVAPTHVSDLDIRPESLPADIGAAARSLWQRGEQRAALALLYRGLISRLVHVHGVPIRGSSTEGECLALAAPRLAAVPQGYAARLVRTWQQSVYGGRAPAPEAVLALCDEFAAALGPRDALSASPATT
jgi:hypothetical protein